MIFSPHDGHWISEPAPELSTASSCSQWGQLKTISISVNRFMCDSHDINPVPPRKPEKNHAELFPLYRPRRLVAATRQSAAILISF